MTNETKAPCVAHYGWCLWKGDYLCDCGETQRVLEEEAKSREIDRLREELEIQRGQVKRLESALMRLTNTCILKPFCGLDEHPEWLEDTCMCDECKRASL